MTKRDLAAIRNRIRRARLTAGLSIPTLAAKIGCVHSTLMRWEGDGPAQPRVGDLLDIARVTGVSATWLLTGEGVGPVEARAGL